MSIKILVLEDDLLFGESIVDLLEEEGYEVYLSRNGQDALEASYKSKFDLYLLDINVPLLDGLKLLQELRLANDTTPAIYITSYTDTDTLAQAYEYGADDYLKKPLDTRELLLRIQAIFRRARSNVNLISLGDISIDELHKRIFMQNKELTLSPKEYQLMALFIKNAGETVTKEMIVNALWSPAESVSNGSVRVYINRLKQEIGSDRIINIRGLGYRLVS